MTFLLKIFYQPPPFVVVWLNKPECCVCHLELQENQGLVEDVKESSRFTKILMILLIPFQPWLRSLTVIVKLHTVNLQFCSKRKKKRCSLFYKGWVYHTYQHSRGGITPSIFCWPYDTPIASNDDPVDGCCNPDEPDPKHLSQSKWIWEYQSGWLRRIKPLNPRKFQFVPPDSLAWNSIHNDIICRMRLVILFWMPCL